MTVLDEKIKQNWELTTKSPEMKQFSVFTCRLFSFLSSLQSSSPSHSPSYFTFSGLQFLFVRVSIGRIIKKEPNRWQMNVKNLKPSSKKTKEHRKIILFSYPFHMNILRSTMPSVTAIGCFTRICIEKHIKSSLS